MGSLLRTSEGLGLQKVFLTGYTPYPTLLHDSRLPHLAQKIDRQIAKTALGAESLIAWEHQETIDAVIAKLRTDGFVVQALEQTTAATPLNAFIVPEKLALVVGREVEGIEPEVLALCDGAIEIPMLGKKESFNVVQAAAMALYHCRYSPYNVL